MISAATNNVKMTVNGGPGAVIEMPRLSALKDIIDRV